MSGVVGQNRLSKKEPGLLTRLLKTGYFKVYWILSGLDLNRFFPSQRMQLMLS